MKDIPRSAIVVDADTANNRQNSIDQIVGGCDGSVLCICKLAFPLMKARKRTVDLQLLHQGALQGPKDALIIATALVSLRSTDGHVPSKAKEEDHAKRRPLVPSGDVCPIADRIALLQLTSILAQRVGVHGGLVGRGRLFNVDAWRVWGVGAAALFGKYGECRHSCR